MDDKYPHKLLFNDAARKRFDRIAALLDLDNWKKAITYSGHIALQCAEQAVKGNTKVLSVKPEFALLYENNPEFFNALCEDGVVEWLTPLVLAKSINPHPMTISPRRP
jgi:hypothetical protein